MNPTRRLILFAAPAVILTPGLLMPVRKIVVLKSWVTHTWEPWESRGGAVLISYGDNSEEYIREYGVREYIKASYRQRRIEIPDAQVERIAKSWGA